MEETEGRKGTEAWGRRCAPDFNKTSWVSPPTSTSGVSERAGEQELTNTNQVRDEREG